LKKQQHKTHLVNEISEVRTWKFLYSKPYDSGPHNILKTRIMSMALAGTDGTRSKLIKSLYGKMPRAQPTFLLSVISLVCLVTLIAFADYDGYEGDDLNSIVPMFHLSEAKQGALLIYRYGWQPLSYELGAGIFRLTNSPTAIFLLAPIAGATSFALLLSIIWHDRSSITPLLTSLVVLLAIPELYFSALYFNSTILGLPLALASLAILRTEPRRILSVFAGLLAGASILMRFDFILVCPALAVVAWQQDGSRTRPTMFTVGVLASLAFAFTAGIFDPKEILQIYRDSTAEMAAMAYLPGWDQRRQFEVLSVMLSPIGWLIIIIGGPIAIYHALRENAQITIIWGIATVLLLLPFRNLLSVKYALPTAIFLCLFLVKSFSAIEIHLLGRLRPWLLRLAALGTITLLFVSFSVYGNKPFVRIETLASRPVPTHDGFRSYGGYVWQIATIDRYASRSDEQLAADEIRKEFLNTSGPDILLVGDENYFSHGSIAWRHLQLELERAGIRGNLKAPHEIHFDLDGRKLIIVRELSSDYGNLYNSGRGVKLYDFRE
jgi:hypothetical protein